jgi:O-antigen biosynthesis protein
VKSIHLSLQELYASHTGKVSDKWSAYLLEYERLFATYRDQPIRLLEIGVQNGGSLEIWSRYFPSALSLIGCDIDPKCADLRFDDPRILLVIGDASSDAVEQQVLKHAPEFDVIIDDGSHHSSDIVRSFVKYFHHLTEGGIYVTEDLHCSYWQSFEGGIHNPYSSLAFFKRLADIINYEHWGVDRTRHGLLKSFCGQYDIQVDDVSLAQIHSIEFINSMCVVKKAPSLSNALGKRIVAGSSASIDAAPVMLSGSAAATPDQSANPWSIQHHSIEEELAHKLEEVQALALKQENSTANFFQPLAAMQNQFNAVLEQTTARENSLQRNINSLTEVVDSQRRDAVRHTAEFSSQLQALYKDHQRQLLAASATHAERENALMAQLHQIQLQIQKQFVEASRKDSEFVEKLHEQYKSQQALSDELLLTRIRMEENTRLAVDMAQRDFRDTQAKLIEEASVQHQVIANLRTQLAFMQMSYSWKFTAPLRLLAKLLGLPIKQFRTAASILQLKNNQQNQAFSVIKDSELQHFNIKGRTTMPLVTNTKAVHNNQAATNLDDLLELEDEQFIVCAYLTLLGRPPDSEGFKYYCRRLHNGVSKLGILKQIVDSSEAKSANKKLPGLLEALAKERRLNVPVLGSLLRLLSGQRRNSTSAQILRVVANRIYRLDAGLQERLSLLDARVGHVEVLLQQFDERTRQDTDQFSDTGNFDTAWYLEQNPDVAASGLSPFEHFRTIGKFEGRSPAFDGSWYFEEYSDVQGTQTDALLHYKKIGKFEGRHAAFNRHWYLDQYPDVASFGMDPYEHYKKYGKAEGRVPAFNRNWYLMHYPDVSSAGLDPYRHYINHGKKEGRYPAASAASARNDYTAWIRKFDTLSDASRATIRSRIEGFESRPLISVVMPVYNPGSDWLERAIESIRAQLYPNWELCIADDASPDPAIRVILERYAKTDPRIKVIFRDKNGHISAASNSALTLAQGEWIALLDHDDELPEHALFWVADAVNQYPDARMIYSDEDKINEQGARFGPYFKCDWNPDLFYSHNMFSHLGVYHAALVRQVGGFRLGFEGSQDYDLALRCIEHIDAKQIHHIPRVLYHWRVHAQSTASSSDAKPYAMIAGERAINEHLQRRGVDAKAELLKYNYRVRYALPAKLPLVSLIIPTRNGLKLIEQCIRSILTKTTYSNYEILIVDNGSDDPAVLRYFKSLASEPRIRVIRDDRPFNYSALNNAAVKQAHGEIIGLINNDIEVITPDWLSEMVSHALRPEVGAVGAKLLYPDDTVQHAGVILGVGGVAGHAHHRIVKTSRGYLGRADLIQSFSAVTAACLLTRTSVYKKLNGLNENDLTVAYNDIDLCLRMGKEGYQIIWTPYAELYHHESATRGFENTPEKMARFHKEIDYMKQIWRPALQNDLFYNPNLANDQADFSLAWPPRLEIF